jgi:purine-cytosine permease-like protein
MAFWSCCSAMAWIVIATTLASAYGTRNALIGLILTVLSYGAINFFIARYAIRTGLSVSLFSRVLFGRTGSALATLIFAATAIYYAVFEGSVIAVAATFLYGGLDYKIAALIVVLYSVPLVFGSVQHWLDKFNGVLLPI